MNFKKEPWAFALLSILLILASLASCSNGGKSFSDETITAENKAEIAGKAKTDLTLEEARLLGEYLKRFYPGLAEGDLPSGRTINQMIGEEMALASSTRPASQSSLLARDLPHQAETTAPPMKSADTPAPKTVIFTPQSGSSSQAETVEYIPVEVFPETPQPIVVEIVSGTDIKTRLVESLSTRTAQNGDHFEMELAEDLTIGEHLIALKGSRTRGRIISSESSGKVKGLAAISLSLTDLYVEGEQYPLQAETLNFQAEKTTGKDAAKVGIGAGIGAIIGGIAGGGKGAAIGAGVGAGAGTTVVLATKGDELEFPVEQVFQFRLTKSFKAEVIRD